MMRKTMLGIAVLALLAVLPATFAYNSYVTHPYAPYWNGQLRATSYTSVWPIEQGMYAYASPPLNLVRYGVGYHWGSNVRWPYYDGDPHALSPGIYRPYYGYPAQGYGNPYWEYYRRYS